MMGSNQPDTMTLAIHVAETVAMAKLDELEFQSFRLRDMVDVEMLDKQRAIDILWTAAVASDLVRVHGADGIQAIIAPAFQVGS